MASLLDFVERELVVDRRSRCWIDTKRFQFAPGSDDRALLSALIDDRQYADAYAGDSVRDDSRGSEHGPYRRDAITPASFRLVTAEAALEALDGWMETYAAALVEPSISPRISSLQEPLRSLCRAGVRIYDLVGLDEAARHDWGWVVGTHGFHEYVVIDNAQSTLELLVASDD